MLKINFRFFKILAVFTILLIAPFSTVAQTTTEINDLKSKISDKKQATSSLASEIDKIEQRLADLSKSERTLETQIEQASLALEQATLQVEDTENKIAEANTQKIEIESEIVKVSGKIDEDEKLINDIVYSMYLNKTPEIIDIILGVYDTAEISSKNDKLDATKKLLSDTLLNLSIEKEKLNSEHKKLTETQRSLTELMDSLLILKRDLNDQISYKNKLLSEVQTSKGQLANDLSSQRADYDSSLKEVQSLQKDLALKIAEQNRLIEEAKKKADLEAQRKAEAEKQKLLAQQNNASNVSSTQATTVSANYAGSKTNSLPRDVSLRLSWPLPSNYSRVTAYFMDSEYKRLFGVNHYAIDISAPQSTKLRAVADGVVKKIKDAGYGYSYIMIDHGDGVYSVFGHISEFPLNLSEGDSVKRGDVIALSGGAPGTKGAGRMTTGPHLHFEVWVDNIPVDPLLLVNRP